MSLRCTNQYILTYQYTQITVAQQTVGHLRRLTSPASIHSLAICPLFGFSQWSAPAGDAREKKEDRVFILWILLCGVTSGPIPLKVRFSKWPLHTTPSFWELFPLCTLGYIIPSGSSCLHFVIVPSFNPPWIILIWAWHLFPAVLLPDRARVQ